MNIKAKLERLRIEARVFCWLASRAARAWWVPQPIARLLADCAWESLDRLQACHAFDELLMENNRVR